MQEPIAPMLATAGPLPPSAEDDRWAFEMKWDGVRALVDLRPGTSSPVRVRSRSGRDVTATYPEVVGVAAALPRQAVLDGEIVAVDDAGRPDFGLLQRRMHVARPSAALLAEVPVTLLVFDLLLDGEPLLDRPYAVRRSRLEALDLVGPRWDVPPVFLGSGATALETSRAGGLEGVVAKRVESTYAPGRRSPDWRKVRHQRTQEVVVGGWRPGDGWRSGGVGSLLVGVQGPAGLTYAGRVGTGFTAAALAAMTARLRPLASGAPPFLVVPRDVARDAHWVRPELVGEVVFTGWTADGVLRHPVWRGLRSDKDPSEAVPED